jgi:hypothetical protein
MKDLRAPRKAKRFGRDGQERAALRQVRRDRGCFAAGLFDPAGLPVSPGRGRGRKGGTCAAFTVSTGGRTFSGDQTKNIPADRVDDRIRVDGRYIEFNVRSRNFATLNYRHNTGVATPHSRRG